MLNIKCADTTSIVLLVYNFAFALSLRTILIFKDKISLKCIYTISYAVFIYFKCLIAEQY